MGTTSAARAAARRAIADGRQGRILGRMSALDGMMVEALVIVPAVAACRWINRRRGAGAQGDPLGPPDPYAVAWLRGGPTAVLQLAAYDLVRSSRLAVMPTGPGQGAQAPALLLVPLPERAGADALPEAARRLLPMVTAACDRARLASFARELAPCFDATDRTQLADGLLSTPAQRNAGWTVTLLGMAAVIGVAIWQLQDAERGPQGGAVALACLAAIGLAALRLVTAPEPRLSPRGRAFLTRLAGDQAAAAGTRRGMRWIAAAATATADHRAPAPGLLEVAVSGMPALNGTAYAGLVALLDPASLAPGPPLAQEFADDALGPDLHPPEGSAQR